MSKLSKATFGPKLQEYYQSMEENVHIRFVNNILAFLQKLDRHIVQLPISLRVGVVAFVTIIVIFLSIILSSNLKLGIPFLLFFLPIILGTWYLKFAFGMILTIIMTFFVLFFVLNPYAPSINGEVIFRTLLFLLEGIFLTFSMETFRQIEENLQFLASSGKILSSSLDYNTTFNNIANLVVSSKADLCVIDLIEKNGDIRHVAIVDKDKARRKLYKEILESPPNPEGKQGIYEVARTARPLLISPVTNSWIQSVSKNDEDAKTMKKMKLVSQMFLPLVSRERVIGVLWIASQNPRIIYTPFDLTWAMELATRAAVSVDNTLLYKEAQEAVRARDEFLSIASHELKTPLTSIMLQLQVALHKLRAADKNSIDENVSKLLENAQHQSKRLRRLINDLLNTSLISTGRLQLEKEDVNFSKLVRHVLDRFKEQIDATDYKVETDIEEKVIGALDRVRIEQVVINLITNAMKYGEGKPISIQVKKSDIHILFLIKDQGIGIESNLKEIVFERFSRGVKSHKYRGLGIGLYICRQIVEAHGGTIELKSEPGKGSTFTVKFPL